LVVSISIVQAAVQTAMKVTPAMRAKLLSAHPALNPHVFPAGVTDLHFLIIHINIGERKGGNPKCLEFGVPKVKKKCCGPAVLLCCCLLTILCLYTPEPQNPSTAERSFFVPIT